MKIRVEASASVRAVGEAPTPVKKEDLMTGKVRSWMWQGLVCFGLAVGIMVLIPRTTVAAESTATPTFTKDIAPIFQAKCEACHRPNSMAPMSLVTYQDARPWARSIKARVAARQMPPWHIDKNVGIQEFKNDRSLSDREIDVITRWAD